MKRLWLFALFILFTTVSCSFFNNVELYPPSWIQGRWSTDTGTPSADMAFVFTDSNCTMVTSTYSISFIDAYKSTNMDDLATDMDYKIWLNSDGTDAVYYFIKETSTIIRYTNTVNGITIGPLYFYKE